MARDDYYSRNEDGDQLLPQSPTPNNERSDAKDGFGVHDSQGHYTAIAISWILGCAFLFPWNVILTIEDYYYVVFPDYHPSRVFTVIYEPLGLLTTLIFVIYEARASTRWRVLSGFVIFLSCLSLLIVVDAASHGNGGVPFFVVICFLIAMFGIGDGVAQGGLVGDLAFMHPTYMQAYYAGLAASGVASTVLRMITKVAFGESDFGLRKGSFVFLGCAGFVEIIGIALYALVFPNLPVIKGYRLSAAKQGALTVGDDLNAAGLDSQDTEHGNSKRKTMPQLLHENWDYSLMLVLIYLLSLSIFPGFLYEDTGKHKLGSWYALVLIAMYNAADLISRYIPLIPGLFMNSRRVVMISCWARFAFIPAFYFAAKYADAGYMIFLCLMLGLTNGYLTVVVFVKAPQGYTGPEQNALGNILTLFLVLGLSLGVISSWLWLIGKGW